jgi:hypothetical protein
MLLFLAAAVTAVQAETPVRALAQARVTVRIEQGIVLRFAELERDQPQRLHDRIVRAADGSVEPARLIEFE